MYVCRFAPVVALKLNFVSSLSAYMWDQVPADSVVCDIGGGNGHVTMGLVKQFPHLKIVLQDLAPVVQQGREVST